MFVKIIGSTQKTIEPYVCFNPFVHSLSSQKKYLCKLLMKIEGGGRGDSWGVSFLAKIVTTKIRPSGVLDYSNKNDN